MDMHFFLPRILFLFLFALGCQSKEEMWIESWEKASSSEKISLLRKIRGKEKEMSFVIPFLQKALLDENIQEKVARTLTSFGTKAQSIRSDLLTLAQNTEEEWVLDAAIVALGKTGPLGITEVPVLIKALHSSEWAVRYHGAVLLSRAKGAELALADLIWALRDSSSGVRYYAARTLGSLGIEAKSAITHIISTIDNNDWSTAEEGVIALGKMESHGAEAIGSLLYLLAQDGFIRHHSAIALGKMGLIALDPLISFLEKPVSLGHVYAVYALGEIGSPALKAVPLLLQFIAKEDSYLKEYTIQALSKIGPQAKAAIPHFLPELSSPHWEVRAAVVMALGNMGEHSKEIFQALRETAEKDTDLRVRNLAEKSRKKLLQEKEGL